MTCRQEESPGSWAVSSTESVTMTEVLEETDLDLPRLRSEWSFLAQSP